jgi:hypothetical protein
MSTNIYNYVCDIYSENEIRNMFTESILHFENVFFHCLFDDGCDFLSSRKNSTQYNWVIYMMFICIVYTCVYMMYEHAYACINLGVKRVKKKIYFYLVCLEKHIRWEMKHVKAKDVSAALVLESICKYRSKFFLSQINLLPV